MTLVIPQDDVAIFWHYNLYKKIYIYGHLNNPNIFYLYLIFAYSSWLRAPKTPGGGGDGGLVNKSCPTLVTQ